MIGGAVLVRDKARAAAQVVTGPTVDTINYKGAGVIAVQIGSPVLGATNYVGTAAIQSSADGSTSWANVSGKTATVTGATGGRTAIPWEFGAGNRYLRATFTTTNDVSSVSATLHSFK
jgi:hypothetical protein